MKLKKIPAILVNYTDIEIWSLRPEITLTHQQVIDNAIKGNIYPEKTVKHNFNFNVPIINYKINKLKE